MGRVSVEEDEKILEMGSSESDTTLNVINTINRTIVEMANFIATIFT